MFLPRFWNKLQLDGILKGKCRYIRKYFHLSTITGFIHILILFHSSSTVFVKLCFNLCVIFWFIKYFNFFDIMFNFIDVFWASLKSNLSLVLFVWKRKSGLLIDLILTKLLRIPVHSPNQWIKRFLCSYGSWFLQTLPRGLYNLLSFKFFSWHFRLHRMSLPLNLLINMDWCYFIFLSFVLNLKQF